MRKRDNVIMAPVGNDPKEWAEYRVKEAEYDKWFSRRRKLRRFRHQLFVFIGWLAAVVAAVASVISLFK